MAFWNKLKNTPNKSQSEDPLKPDFLVQIGTDKLSWNANDETYLKNFLEIPEVNSIINTKARARTHLKYDIISKETGKPIKNNEPIIRALRNPNYFQSQKEFIMQSVIYQEVFGNEFLYFLTPYAQSTNIIGLFTLNPLFMDIKEDNVNPFWLEKEYNTSIKYTATWGGRIYTINPDDIIHINNCKANTKQGDVFCGESTMRSLLAPIANIRAAYEARNELIVNRGAIGILSNDGTDIAGALPLDDKEKSKLQSEYQNRYGLTKDKFKLIITSLKLRWQQMSIDVDKMKLFDEVKADMEQLCDGYGVPFELFANQKGTTFENQKNAEKRFYTNTIIPEANEWVGAINRRFKDKPWEVIVKYDHLDVFSDDLKNRAQALTLMINALSRAFQDQVITMEEYRFELSKLKIGK